MGSGGGSLTVHLQDGSDGPGEVLGFLRERGHRPGALLVARGEALGPGAHLRLSRAGGQEIRANEAFWLRE